MVASEVKTLATQTARATDQIGAQIVAIRAATGEAVDGARYKPRHRAGVRGRDRDRSGRRLKHYRSIATRYDKTARSFLAAVYMAGAIVWLI